MRNHQFPSSFSIVPNILLLDLTITTQVTDTITGSILKDGRKTKYYSIPKSISLTLGVSMRSDEISTSGPPRELYSIIGSTEFAKRIQQKKEREKEREKKKERERKREKERGREIKREKEREKERER